MNSVIHRIFHSHMHRALLKRSSKTSGEFHIRNNLHTRKPRFTSAKPKFASDSGLANQPMRMKVKTGFTFTELATGTDGSWNVADESVLLFAVHAIFRSVFDFFIRFSTMSSVADQNSNKYRQWLNRAAAAKRWKKNDQESTYDPEIVRYVQTLAFLTQEQTQIKNSNLETVL